MKYIGVDIHKQYFVATVMNQEGNVETKNRVSMDRASIQAYFKALNGEGNLKAVIEAGYGWSYFYDQIQELVQDVKLAHPLKTKAIADARIKTDSIDSEVLAHLLRADLIPEAYIPDARIRDTKHLIRYRMSLRKMSKMLKNKIHAVLDRNHIEDPGFRGLSDKFGKKGRAYIKAFKLQGTDTKIVRNYLSLLEVIDKKRELVEKKIKKLFEEDDICKLLKTIPGIGELSAMVIRYEIGDIERFPSAKKLCSYAGLVPSTFASGGKVYQGRITKQGNTWLRWILGEIAACAIVKDAWLRSYCSRVAKRGGRNKARVAVARKLLEIIYKVWKEKRPYYEKPVAVALSIS
jgi:transposase